MAILFGTLAMGRVERVAGCVVLTRFSMINGLPLRAFDSFVDMSALNGGAAIPIDRHRRSVLAGFLRPWLTALAAGLVLCSVAWPLLLVVAVPLLALAGYLWAFYGQLSPSETRRRLAYATWTGVPFDPAYLPDATTVSFAATLRQVVDERTAQAPVGYRAKLAEPWMAVAVDSDDPELLIASLVRARVERLGADAARRAELDALHDAVWVKLDPHLARGDAPRAFLDWSARAARDARTAKLQPLLVMAAIAAVCVTAVAFVGFMIFDMRPRLAVVNVSGADGLTVLLDGEPLATGLPTARREDDGAFVVKRVKAGAHELVTRDAAGVEIDRRSFTVPEGHSKAGSYLYVPVQSTSVCFFRELVTYARDERYQSYDVVRLELTEPLLVLAKPVNHWFTDPPRSVDAGKSAVTTERRTVRAWPCDTKLTQ